MLNKATIYLLAANVLYAYATAVYQHVFKHDVFEAGYYMLVAIFNFMLLMVVMK